MENQPSMDDQFLRKIYHFIEDNLDNEDFSVEKLSQKVGLSRSMLHRKLIKLTGKSASDLITERRLLRAKELLENNVATASEIAYKVGFSSPSYFTKVFKNYFRVSPGDVRKGTIPVIPNEIQPIARKKIKHLSLISPIVILLVVIAGACIYFIFRKDESIDMSIAILPFDNLSSSYENQFFADGIVEDLLNRLSKIEGLKVISRTSSEMFRDKGSKTIPEIANILGVSYILEGTVQRQSDKLRINIQLIDARRDVHVLSEQYDRNLSEIFHLQSEVAGQIASEIAPIVTKEQRNTLQKNQTTNLKAFEYKQLGRYHLNKRTLVDVRKSINYFKQSLQEDPEYSLVYAELAEAYYILGWYNYVDMKAGLDSAKIMASKALLLDENNGEAHNVMGAIFHEYDHDYTLAEEEFKLALAANPSYAPAYSFYADLMISLGDHEKARELYNKALQLDPYSYIIRFASSYAYFREKKYQQAIVENKICQGLGNDYPGPITKEFFIYAKIGNSKAALESFKKLGQITGEWTPEIADSIFIVEGINGLLKWKLKIGNWPYKIEEAHYYTFLGETDKALTILERALNEGYLVPFNTADPEFEALHTHPRFIAIRKKMGLPAL